RPGPARPGGPRRPDRAAGSADRLPAAAAAALGAAASAGAAASGPAAGAAPAAGALRRPGPVQRRLIEFDDFLKVDMRVGRVVEVEDFPEARKPAWKLRIDFGPELGEKRSSAQITNYTREQLEGSLVVAVVNFPPRQIGPVRSEVLVLGAVEED